MLVTLLIRLQIVDGFQKSPFYEIKGLPVCRAGLFLQCITGIYRHAAEEIQTLDVEICYKSLELMLMRQFHLVIQTAFDIIHIAELLGNVVCHGYAHTDTSPGLGYTIMVRCPCVMMKFSPSSAVLPVRISLRRTHLI